MKENTLSISYTVNSETARVHTEVEADGEFDIDDFALLLANCCTALNVSTAELFAISYEACKILKEKKGHES